MEKEMELSTERPSLLILNEYCLLEIFEFLELDDSMNLAECCNRLRRVADRAAKIKSKFELNGNMFRKGDKYINRVFTHIGHNVSWLTINCREIIINCRGINPNLSKIISDCNNLNSLQIFFWRGSECCCFEDEELTALLNNNPEIESLCDLHGQSDGNFRIFQLLEPIPKVERLCLAICRTLNTTALNSLLTLNELRKLRLDCNHNNINHVLSELARKGIMQGMELRWIEIDDNFFDILNSFDRLEFLAISADSIVKVKSSTIWPTNLKLLRLENIEFTHLSFISTIQQLKTLEYVDIQLCCIAESDVADMKNVEKLSRNILNVMNHRNRKQRLEVVLPYDLFEEGDWKTHVLLDLKPLRILSTNPRITIYFPGLECVCNPKLP